MSKHIPAGLRPEELRDLFSVLDNPLLDQAAPAPSANRASNPRMDRAVWVAIRMDEEGEYLDTTSINTLRDEVYAHCAQAEAFNPAWAKANQRLRVVRVRLVIDEL